MTDSKENATDPADHTPNFELPLRGAIREDNWAEYEARGFQPVRNTSGSALELDYAQSHYGVEHVYTGDSYDDEAARPLQHKPGTGLYVDPEGLKIGEINSAKHQKWLDAHG
jgi:hypothetical protein